jgi:tetratricopeptide (TPR) repeat protein
MMAPRASVSVLAATLFLPALALAESSFRCPAKGGSEWRIFESEHFVLRTDLDPPRAKEMVRELELARAAVLHAMFARPPPVPGRIEAIAFASEPEFWDVAPDHAAAYVTTVDGFTPLVVLPGTLKAATRTLLIHELTHHLSSFPLLRKPLWLDEGFAMYLESMGSVALGARMTVGSVPEMLLVPRRRSERVLVRDLLSWKRIEPDWGSTTVRRHYVSSWFLVHYLVNKQTPALYEFFRRLGRAEDPRAAWKGAFPRWDPDVPDALDDLEEALDTYGRGESFSYRELELQVSPEVTWRPLPSSEVHAYRAVLLPNGGERRPEVIRAEVSEALAEDPADPLAIAVLARLDPKADLLPMCRASAKTHPGDWRAWSALGDALQGGPREELLAARRKAVEVGPTEPVALRELARDLAAAGEAKEAAALALALLRVAPWSPATHETVALVAMKLGLCADALRSQQRAIDTLHDRAPPKAREEKERVLAGYARACAAQPTPATSP